MSRVGTPPGRRRPREPGRPGPLAVLRDVTKQYGQRAVIPGLDLELPAASLVGLLGPNGSGKTTLLKLLAGLLRPDRGVVEIAGLNLSRQEAQARRALAYVPDTPHVYVELTVLEHLELVARAHGVLKDYADRAEQLLRRFDLWEARNAHPFALSRGMLQKLALCCALVRPSRVLLLDEPGATLDIASVQLLYESLAEYRRGGGLVILSSHQWETLQRLCDRFVLLAQGRVVAQGDLTRLRATAKLTADASLRDIYLALLPGEAGALPEADGA